MRQVIVGQLISDAAFFSSVDLLLYTVREVRQTASQWRLYVDVEVGSYTKKYTGFIVGRRDSYINSGFIKKR